MHEYELEGMNTEEIGVVAAALTQYRRDKRKRKRWGWLRKLFRRRKVSPHDKYDKYKHHLRLEPVPRLSPYAAVIGAKLAQRHTQQLQYPRLPQTEAIRLDRIARIR